MQERLASPEATELCDRLVRYAKINTMSDPDSQTIPTSKRQLDLAKLLKQELEAMGYKPTLYNDFALVTPIAATPGCENAPSIALVAHMDTSSQAPSDKVVPIIHKNYDGKPIALKEGITIDPEKEPILKKCVGDTLITSDGTTLLGSDDKSGVSIVMTIAQHLKKNPGFKHGPLELIFNCDEEVGLGGINLPYDRLKSKYAITIDGETEPIINIECFSASAAKVIFKGISYHPGDARGRLVNAATAAAKFVTMIPVQESPETTDNRLGFYFIEDINGSSAETTVNIIIRDHDIEQRKRREDVVQSLGAMMEKLHPGLKVQTTITETYPNMIEYLNKDKRSYQILLKAATDLRLTPELVPIRGGTDGANMCRHGILTPNLFTGGFGFHSRSECAILSHLVSSFRVLLHTVELWSHEK